MTNRHLEESCPPPAPRIPSRLFAPALLAWVSLVGCSGSVPDWNDWDADLDAATEASSESCTGPTAQSCGKCGRQTRACQGGKWSAWSACASEGTCTAGLKESCGTAGSRSCNSQCTWDLCVEPTCEGQTSETCGKCGTRTRACQGGVWTNWSACSNEGACTANASETCGSGGSRKCNAQCQWDLCSGQTCTGSTTQSCGNCGTQTRTCDNGTWSAWGTCSNEGVCAPSGTQACGTGGSQTCNTQCQWGQCQNQSCSGSTAEACGNCGTRTRTCNNGAWSSWSTCSGEGTCSASATQACGAGGTQTCNTQCQWDLCQGQTCAGEASRACGNCGTDMRVCSNGVWSAWAGCSGEGVCAPSASRACTGGTQSCNLACQWGPCGPGDAGPDAPDAHDAADAPDAHDAADAAETSVDSGHDAGQDATPDATLDAGTDAGVDAAGDGAPDATVDSGTDTGTDVGVEAAPDVATDTSLAAVSLRVYVAGESIEEYNLWKSSPFLSDGTLRSPSTNTLNEYGWMVPFADRLKLRDSGVAIQWVGSRQWIPWSDPWNGTYPTNVAQPTSAESGTTVERWLQYHQDELTQRSYCYDVAIAARAGNDVNEDVSQATFKAQLKLLLIALDAGSNCKTHPLILVTGHMPDNGGGGTDQTWTNRMHNYFVTWTGQVLSDLRNTNPSIRTRFLDGYTGFTVNQATTAFPAPSWLNGDGLPDLGKITWDNYHPKRLASIYYGELVANQVDLAELRSIQ